MMEKNKKEQVITWKTTVTNLRQIAEELCYISEETIKINNNVYLKIINLERYAKIQEDGKRHCPYCGKIIPSSFRGRNCPYCGGCLLCSG